MIAVTGATGKLGALALESQLNVIPANQLVAIVRSPDKASRFASRGVHVRRGDYAAPETLGPALAGVTRLLLVSGPPSASASSSIEPCESRPNSRVSRTEPVLKGRRARP